MKILLVLLLFCTNVLAEDSIVLHGISYHPQVRTYNEVNTGIGLRTYKNNLFFTVGTYKNSLYNQSIYAGIGFNVTSNFNIIAGYITGYPSNKIVLPEFYINVTNNIKLNIMYLPEIRPLTDEVIGISIEIKEK